MQPLAPQIFISHARVDARFADALERTLTFWGSRPWVDRQQLGGGQEWPLALQQAIEQSAGLLLVLTPNALRSHAVRREYLHALSRHIPVLLIRFREVDALPVELANLPILEFRGNALSYGPAFYMALADRGLIPPPPETQLDTITPDAVYRVLAHRAPADWRVWPLPLSAHLLRGIVFGVLSLALIVFSFAPGAFLAQLYHNLYGVLGTLLTIATPAVAIFSGIILLVPAVMHLNAALGRGPRDTIILTPESVTVQIIQQQRLLIRSLPHRYLFRFISQASVQRNIFGVSIVLANAQTRQHARITLPWRWHNRREIADQIVQAINAYHQHMATAQPAPSLPHAPPQPLPATPAEAVPPTIPRQQPAAQPPQPAPVPQVVYPQPIYYTVMASGDQQKLVTEIQNWLGQRMIAPGEMVQDRGLILPTARGAAWSRFVLVLITPQLMQSPACRAILADLRRQGKLIIPIRLNAKVGLPPELAAVQWVDFSPEQARALSFIDLCDTLDRAGIPLVMPGNAFDGTLALARGIHQHLPPGWQAFRPDTSAQRVYRTRQIMGRFYGLLLAGFILAIMVLFVVYAVNIFHPTTLSDWGTVIAAWLVTIIIVGVISIPMLRNIFIRIRSARFYTRLLKGQVAPECLVVTPQGIAFHVAQSRQRPGFIDGSYAFGMLRSLERHDTLFGIPQLRLVFANGAHQDVPLLFFGAVVDAAIAQAVAAWSAYAAAVQMPAMGAVMSPRQ